MSRYLCKLAKGALAPLQVKPVEDGEDNPLYTLHVHKTHHRAGPPSNFNEASLNDIRRPEFPPERPRTLEKREQLGQIPEQPGYELRVLLPPPTGEGLCMGHRLGPISRLIDGLGIGLHGRVIAPPSRAQQITELVDPTALMGYAGIDHLQRCRQPRTAIGHDQLELVAFQATPIKIQQEAFPGCLALPCASGEPEQVPRAIRPNTVGD
mgnify:FL=1